MRKQRDDGKLQEAIQLTLNRVQRYEQVGPSLVCMHAIVPNDAV